MMRVRIIVLATLLVLPQLVFGQVQEMSEEDFTSARQCGQCHQEIYNQWGQSMHSKSLTDPIYRAVVDEMLRMTGGEQKTFCLSCHAPIASVAGKLQDLPVPLDWEGFGEVAREGVTCDFCHTISGK